MSYSIKNFCKFAFTLILLSSSTQAAVVFDETVSGDLSGDFSTPQALTFNSGLNTIIGEVGSLNGNTGATNGADADYFSFNIAAGLQLTSIVVDSYAASPGSTGFGSFIAYTSGTGFPGQGFSDIEGFWLFNDASGDLMASTSSPPFSPGDYSFWIQETEEGEYDYTISFGVTPVPLPAGFILLASTMVGLVPWMSLRRNANIPS